MKARTTTFSSTTSARKESDSFHFVVNGIFIFSSMLRFKKHPIDPGGNPIQDDSLLGTPQSHGCVRMNQGDAKILWDWSTVGTTVVVTDIGY